MCAVTVLAGACGAAHCSPMARPKALGTGTGRHQSAPLTGMGGWSRPADFPMNPTIDTLRQLQQGLQVAPVHAAENENLRARLPAPVLAHFDRQIAMGRRGVAEVNGIVCGGCHLRLSVSMAGQDVAHEGLPVCENCGAFLSFTLRESAVCMAVERPRRRYRASSVG